MTNANQHPTCDSCGTTAALTETPHHQAGNARVWHYCVRCVAPHEKEVAVRKQLEELQQTHAEAGDRPDVVGLLHQGASVEVVKQYLDRTAQPPLEAELVS